MYSLQKTTSINDTPNSNNFIANSDNLKNVILQEQEEYKKLIKTYNSMVNISFYYYNQIKTHQVEFENLKQKLLENQDLQKITTNINKIFSEFNIKNQSDNVSENINTIYNYILHLRLTNQENAKNLNITNKSLFEIKNKISNIYSILEINEELINDDENFNTVFSIISNIIEENKLLKENNTQNNVDLINRIKQLEEENKSLINKNIELNKTNSELNEEINQLIQLEDEYNDYKFKQEELLKLSNKTINEIHKKEITNLNEIQKQRIEENKKLLKINEELTREVNELKKGFADLDEYKKQIIMLSKDINTIKNSVSVQNFNEINSFNDFDQNKPLIETKSKNDDIEVNTPKIIKNVSFKRNSSFRKSPKEQLKEWFSNIDNKHRIRKQDIPDIQFSNTSLIILLCKARNYYKLDNTDKMTYGQFKNYLYTISEIRNELL